MEMDPFFAVTDAVDKKTSKESTTTMVKNETKESSSSSNLESSSLPPPSEKESRNNNNELPPESPSVTDTLTSTTESNVVVPSETKTSTSTTVNNNNNNIKSPTNTSTTNQTSSTGNNNNSSSSSGDVIDYVQLANEELANLLLNHGSITQSQVSSLQRVLRENGLLKAKINKLKSLLQRSAKAQKDAKVELSQSKMRSDQAQNQILQLQRRVDHLTNRPTHMDLLADFESNFDKALLSFHNQPNNNTNNNNSSSMDESFTHHQPGGQGSSAESFQGGEEEEELVEQLQKANARIQQLESRLKNTSAKRIEIEDALEETKLDRDLWQSKCNDYQLESRMAKMEMERACRAVKEKSATLEEMQFEMNLMYKSVSDAYAQASDNSKYNNNNNYYLPNNNDQDSLSNEKAEEMKAKMEALQEWAIASANVKSVLTERIAILTEQVKELKRPTNDNGDINDDFTSTVIDSSTPTKDMEGGPHERKLWSKTSSLVVGAGMVGSFVVYLGDDLNIQQDETIILKWKFDITPADTDIEFSILKGVHQDKLSRARRHTIDTVLKDTHVISGGAGEVQGAFAIQNACTLVWSNEKSWIRPKTIKFYLQAYAIL